MPDLPSLGPEPEKKSPLPLAIAVAVGVGLVAGGIFWWRKGNAAEAAQREDAKTPAQVEVAKAAPPPPAEETRTPKQRLDEAGLKAISVSIEGPLETAIVRAAGKEVGPALTQVVTRALVWWVTVPSDLLRGDRLEVLYEERDGEEPVVHAVRFQSGKTEKVHEAYRFQSDAHPYPHLYDPEGEELELRLRQTPIETYEQITSLLRDGRGHKGVDFKAPEGTPVLATFDGTITRRNWNFRGNGNSLEVTSQDRSYKAIYLHLSELPAEVKVGMEVKAGQLIAHSGNTGRSFAPHLHYQLMRRRHRKVLDPFDHAPTVRRAVPEAERAAFDAHVRKLRALFGPAVAGR